MASVIFVASILCDLPSWTKTCYRCAFIVSRVSQTSGFGRVLRTESSRCPVVTLGCLRSFFLRSQLCRGPGFGRSRLLKNVEFLLGRGFITPCLWQLCWLLVVSLSPTVEKLSPSLPAVSWSWIWKVP